MSVRTLEVIEQELKAARTERVKFVQGTAEFKTADARVQALKGEKAAFKAPVQTPKPAAKSSAPSTVVVLPAFPQLYSVLTFQHQRMTLGGKVEVAFSHKSLPSGEDLKMWQTACYGGNKPVLVDLVEKAEKGYACVSANALPDLSSSVGGSTIFNKLTKPDTLRAAWQTRYSIGRLLNDAYFLGGEDTEQKIFDRAVDVVSACLKPGNGRDWATLTKGSYKNDLQPLWEGFNVNAAEVVPFTIQHYFMQLFCAGVSRPEMQEKVGLWIAFYKAVAKKKETANKNFIVKPFMIQGLPAGFVSVASYWEAGSFHFHWLGNGFLKLSVLRTPKGHVVIQAAPKHKNVDLTRLYNRLAADEPRQWKLRSADSALVNGGFRFDGDKPTSKGSEELIRLASKYVKLRN